ncbi:hypothetical protein KA977_15860, partial [Candidatus Dependentiae bacterium]|nr:hypothetical protein [Candidatus Dependentiae bacterium]
NNGITSVKFNSSLDAVEFAISKFAMQSMGWSSGSPLKMQCFTVKDGTNDGLGEISGKPDITDAVGVSVNPWDTVVAGIGNLAGYVSSTDTTGRAKYSVIIHGNQSLNPLDAISSWIYDDVNVTPNGNPTGYHRTIETHLNYKVPVNIHNSASLATVLQFSSHNDSKRDGIRFNSLISSIVNNYDSGALIGGVYGEHIMPYFEGEVNSKSLEIGTRVLMNIYNLIKKPRVFWVPERVIKGSTFRDIINNYITGQPTGYTAAILDEITHLKSWYGTDNPNKIHTINGVKCFMINDNADQKKFWVQDGGLHLETRKLLLDKAKSSDQEQLVLVFDDWEAYAGKSFGSGVNDNPDNYDKTIKWIANHQWIEVVTLEQILDRNWKTIEHVNNNLLSLQTYEWLKHASDNSYDNWYNGSSYEDSFKDAVPVLTGQRYGSKTLISNNKKYGDINTTGTIIRDVWDSIKSSPDNNLKELAYYAYEMLIFETAWHDEDNNDYAKNSDGTWVYPDISRDNISGWALNLHGQIRQIGIITAAATWAENVKTGAQSSTASAQLLDLDFDGESEYVLKNNKVFAVFENDGGRLVAGFAYDPGIGGIICVGAPSINSDYEGEEEGVKRCSSFKDLNEDKYVNDIYSVQIGTNSLQFTSSDGKIQKTITLNNNSDVLNALYAETVNGPLYVRFGFAPNNIDLLNNGRENLIEIGSPSSDFYGIKNINGGQAFISFGSAKYNSSSTRNNKNLPLITEYEIYGDTLFEFGLTMNNGAGGIDNIKPVIVSVVPVDNTTLDVLFSEYISDSSARILSNYSISVSSAPSQTLQVLYAQLKENKTAVRLTTSPQNAVDYNITINNIQDRAV